MPWFFALSHTNYAGWLPVHIRDMILLEESHPAVSAEFMSGNFVVQKTQRNFYSIPIDYAHEQNNKCVKGDGGAIGLTENTSELLQWMVSGPEIARVINEFQASQEMSKHEKEPDFRHHEEIKGVQDAFVKEVKSPRATIEEMGNPFMESSENLLVLDTHDIADSSVTDTIKNIVKNGKRQYEEFVTKRLVKRNKSLLDPIQTNKNVLFSCPPLKTVSKKKMQIATFKQNCSLFAQLYVSCQVREGDLDDFFQHENQSFPPSLSQQGNLHHGSKSDLLECFKKLCPAQEDVPDADVLILDGAAIVNMPKPDARQTFQDYTDNVFIKYLERQLCRVSRIDIAWDIYKPDSLKSMACSRRDKGVRRRVESRTRAPSNWQSFLLEDENKSELFEFLAEESVKLISKKKIISTKGRSVICSQSRERDNLQP